MRIDENEDYERLIEQTTEFIAEPMADPVVNFVMEAGKTAIISLIVLGCMVILFWALV